MVEKCLPGVRVYDGGELFDEPVLAVLVHQHDDREPRIRLPDQLLKRPVVQLVQV